MKNVKLFASLGLAAALVTASAAFANPVQSTSKDTKKAEKASEKAEKKADKKHAEHAKVGATAPAFTLKDSGGKSVSLSDFAGKVVVLEWMNPGCPVCKGKMDDGSVTKMMDASKKINSDVVFLFINSTAAMADKPQESGDYLAAHKVTAPALIDGDGMVGHLYGAKTTPHCFVIDSKGILAYEGAIDDQGSTNYVVGAIQALKDGKAVTPATTKPYGCGVKYAPGPKQG